MTVRVPDSFAQEFFKHIDTARQGISGASVGVLAGERFRELHRAWFRMWYHGLRSVTPLLNFCLHRLQKCPPSEFVTALAAYYEQKLVDEAHHDDYLLADLRYTDVDEGELRREVPPVPIVAMLGSQYFLVEHIHPAAYLGYVGLFEGYPPTLEDIQSIAQKSGIPDEAWSTYRMHGEVDVWHREDLERILDRVPDETWIRRAIIANGLRTAEFYCEALEALGRSAAA